MALNDSIRNSLLHAGIRGHTGRLTEDTFFLTHFAHRVQDRLVRNGHPGAM